MARIRYPEIMSATLTLDDDVTARLQSIGRRQGKSLQELANDLLRRTLGHTEPNPAAATSPLRIKTHSSGRCLLGDFESVADALAQAEGEDFR